MRIDVWGELSLDVAKEIVNQLRQVYDYNQEQLETYLNPIIEDTVELVICSSGGECRVFNLIKNEIDKLKEQGVKIITRATGICYSTAFLILLLGDERYGSDRMVSIMNHEGRFELYQDSTSNQEDYVVHQKKIEDEMDKFIIENTNMTKELLDKYKGRNQWLTYDECIELGVLTEPKEKEEIITEQEAIRCMKEYGYTVVSEKEFAEMTKLQIEN